MEKVDRITTIQQYNDMMGVETLHPLVSVINFSECEPLPFKRAYYGMYCVFLKDCNCGPMTYGNKYYDYQEGTIVTMAPGQVYGIDRPQKVQPHGWALVFHPDFINGTELGRTIKEYHFFSYDIDEALHISQKERVLIEQCFQNMRSELQEKIDKHTQRVVCHEIQLLLDYCLRFYDRQFITRHTANSDLLTRFETLVDDYLHTDDIKQNGLPSVSYFADKLFLSANYFGDLIKKEMGVSPKDYIQDKLINYAKEKLLSSDQPIALVADDLGFQYSNHFTRMFKKYVGVSPSEYRSMN
jgi:AraC family transcriptional activator of pobA